MELYHWQGLAIAYSGVVLLQFILGAWKNYTWLENFMLGIVAWFAIGAFATGFAELVILALQWLEGV